jgi:hypothetical protein
MAVDEITRFYARAAEMRALRRQLFSMPSEREQALISAAALPDPSIPEPLPANVIPFPVGGRVR